MEDTSVKRKNSNALYQMLMKDSSETPLFKHPKPGHKKTHQSISFVPTPKEKLNISERQDCPEARTELNTSTNNSSEDRTFEKLSNLSQNSSSRVSLQSNEDLPNASRISRESLGLSSNPSAKKHPNEEYKFETNAVFESTIY
jgi:hypothetical protein